MDINASKVISGLSDIPFFRSISNEIKSQRELIRQHENNLRSNSNKCKDQSEEGCFDVDWEFKYKQLEHDLRVRDYQEQLAVISKKEEEKKEKIEKIEKKHFKDFGPSIIKGNNIRR